MPGQKEAYQSLESGQASDSQERDFVAGLVNKNIVAPLCYQGTMDSTLFNFWLSNFLLPQIGSDHVLING